MTVDAGADDGREEDCGAEELCVIVKIIELDVEAMTIVEMIVNDRAGASEDMNEDKRE